MHREVTGLIMVRGGARRCSPALCFRLAGSHLFTHQSCLALPSERRPVLWLAPERVGRDILEQGRMDVLRDPLGSSGTPSKYDGCTSGSIVRRALLGVADGLEQGHAHSRAAVARDNDAQIVNLPPEPVDPAPDSAPLLLLGCLPADGEGAKCAEGDDVLSEQRSRPHVIDRLHMKLEPLKPAADGGHVILIMAKRMIRRTRDLRTAMALQR
jgi:hypothetical protein